MSEEIMVETSARHVHVSREALDILYGEGYELTPTKWLSQPGQFASEERVRAHGKIAVYLAVSILGPVRPASQVELSATDCRSIGLGIVVRESGDIDGTPGCTIVGPKGEVTIDKGVIVAKRHIHMTPEDAEHYGVTDKQIVSVKVDSADRSLIFGDVVVRVRSDFKLAMHIDTDESNAVLAARDAVGTIIK